MHPHMHPHPHTHPSPESAHETAHETAQRSAPAPAPPGGAWRVQLLGGLRAQRGDVTLTNFSSRSVGTLLARLALFPQRSHAREELIDLIWPGVALDVGRNRLRQALFALRQWLEPVGPPGASGPHSTPVVLADRLSLRVVAGAIDCDVQAFEHSVRDGQPARAVALYTGELLPGFYDDWVQAERSRLAALFDRACADSVAAAQRDAMAGAAASVPGALSAPGVQSGLGRRPAGTARHEPVDVGLSTLPVYLTRFFGRDTEGARLRAEVLAHRLVTLLGPGGSGKTRLAVELADAVGAGGAGGPSGAPGAPAAGRFDFVAFVPLANCSTRAQMLDTLLAGLHLRQPGSDPFEPLVAALGGRRALLVLDNFEQLAGHAEDVVAQLASRIPGLHLLVTSRRVLGLDGEREVAIQPLELPRADLPLEEAAINPAVALFVDRARAVRSAFQLDAGNVASVVALAHLLEGMPLAIELAAARVRSIVPADMVLLLRSAHAAPGGPALALLQRSGPRSGSDLRHATMLGVIEWSWRLLAPAQAQQLAALTVFHGGFTAEAAQAVCGVPTQHISIGLDELVSHSLLRASVAHPAAGGSTRYATFEPVREYAAMQLAAGAAPALRARHRAWLTAWAQALPATPALAEVRAEQPNLLAALASAVADGAPHDAITMLLPLRRVLEDVELPANGLAALEVAVAQCADPVLRSRGHSLLGPMLFVAGRRDDAVAHVERGLATAPADPALRARALHACARVLWRTTREAARPLALLDEAEPLALAAGDLHIQGGLLGMRAFIANHHQRHEEAEALHTRALGLWARGGNQHAINSGRYNLAVCAQQAGRHVETLARLDEFEPGARALHDWHRVNQALNVRGNALSGLRRWPEAVAVFRDGARLSWDSLALHELAYVLWNMPRALAHVRRAEQALQMAGFAEAFWLANFGQLTAADQHDMRRVRRLAARVLGEARHDAARIELLWAQGARLALADAVALALQ